MNGNALNENIGLWSRINAFDGRYFTNDIHAMDDVTNDSTGSVEVGSLCKSYEELATHSLGTRAAGVCEGYNAWFVKLCVRDDLIGQALCKCSAGKLSSSRRIAGLYDKIWDYAVEWGVVERFRCAKSQEISRGTRDVFTIELQLDGALRRMQSHAHLLRELLQGNRVFEFGGWCCQQLDDHGRRGMPSLYGGPAGSYCK